MLNICLTGTVQQYPRSGQGYIAYRLKTVQRNSVNNLKGASKVVYQDGPKTLRETTSTTEQLSGDECTEAISMMKHSTDAPVIKDKKSWGTIVCIGEGGRRRRGKEEKGGKGEKN